MTVQAQVEKSGVVTISALSPGVISEIPVSPGDVVDRGTILVSTATNYQGGDAAALQVSIASRNLRNSNETYDTQKELIQKQKELATRVDENSDEMREISAKSIDETKSLIALNDEILAAFDASITASTDSGTISDLKGVKSQTVAANNQLKNALRNTEFSSSDSEPPAEISNLQEDITKKQLDIQDKAIDLNRDVTRLQLAIAQVQAAAMSPAAPFAGTIQRIFVKVGQAVQPSTPLVIIAQAVEKDPIVAVAYVPRDTAKKVSYLEPSILSIGNSRYEAFPTYITQEAVKGTLYAIYYPIPEHLSGFVTDTAYITVQIPIGVFDTGAVVPYIPIDSVYQTQNESYVFTVNRGKAASKKVLLGNVIGNYVEVKGGLGNRDRVILDRTVIGGDRVSIQE